MASLCVTIAKLTKLTAELRPDETLVEAFEEMGARAEEMTVRNALVRRARCGRRRASSATSTS